MGSFVWLSLITSNKLVAPKDRGSRPNEVQGHPYIKENKGFFKWSLL